MQKTINGCIYCRATDKKLTNEHIVPYAFWGEKQLYKACCKECQDTVSGLELDVLRNTLLPIRTKFFSPTRHKAKRPKELPITYYKNGQKIDTNIPVKDHPTVCFLPVFPLPAFLDKREYISGIVIKEIPIYSAGHPTPIEFAQEFGAETIEWKGTFNSYKGELSFARFLAKIALCGAIDFYDREIIGNSYVNDSILGKVNDIGKWVGCSGKFSNNKTADIHHIEYGIHDDNILVRIQLFSGHYVNVPQYIVVVGKSSI